MIHINNPLQKIVFIVTKLLRLSQLHSIGYRDKTLQDDQEIRHIQQMSLMQQHRDLASKLPAEAAARLVDASYTLCKYFICFFIQ